MTNNDIKDVTLHICAWCQQIKYNNVIITLDKIKQDLNNYVVTHGICTVCKTKMLSQKK